MAVHTATNIHSFSWATQRTEPPCSPLRLLLHTMMTGTGFIRQPTQATFQIHRILFSGGGACRQFIMLSCMSRILPHFHTISHSQPRCLPVTHTTQPPPSTESAERSFTIPFKPSPASERSKVDDDECLHYVFHSILVLLLLFIGRRCWSFLNRERAVVGRTGNCGAGKSDVRLNLIS